MADEVPVVANQAAAQTRPAFMPQVQEGFVCSNRGAVASWGFFSGWLAAGICDMGIVPAILGGVGLSSGYFATGIPFGLGWIPVIGLFAIALVFGASYLLTRRVFATRPREVARRAYWQVVRTMAFAGGLSFVGWVLLTMSVVYGVGGGAMH